MNAAAAEYVLEPAADLPDNRPLVPVDDLDLLSGRSGQHSAEVAR